MLVINALKECGSLTTIQLAQYLDMPYVVVRDEVTRLKKAKRIATKQGRHYVREKTSFITWLFVGFLMLICGWIFVGLVVNTI